MKMLALLLILSSCSYSAAQDSTEASIGWKWLIQYSYQQPNKEKGADYILVQMYDNGRIEYIRHEALSIGGNSAWRRALYKTPKEVEDVKKRIEAIMAEIKNVAQPPTEAQRLLGASIIIRTSEELVKAWGNDRYGDPHEQIPKVFKNLLSLSDVSHRQIQEIFKAFNDEAETLTWKWE